MNDRGIKQQYTFKKVLTNIDDQVIVRNLLLGLVPGHIKEQIIAAFNNYAYQYNKSLVKEYGENVLREGCLYKK